MSGEPHSTEIRKRLACKLYYIVLPASGSDFGGTYVSMSAFLAWRWGVAIGASVACMTATAANAQTADVGSMQPAPTPSNPPVQASSQAQVSGLDNYFENYWSMVRTAQAEQPTISSPLITTTAQLEERVRFDTTEQSVGNGTNVTTIDGGKGVDLIVGPSQEIQVALPAYVIKSAAFSTGKGAIEGLNDWPVFRFKQRLLSSPTDQGNYVVSAWVQVQLPTGIGPYTNHAVTILPTIGGEKGWGDFDVQATIGGSLPTGHVDKIGDSLVGNVAFQYHVLKVLWPQIEASWTYYADGPRGGKSQVYLTPGIVVGRIPLSKTVKVTFGVGYESAITPDYRAKPLLPSFNHGVVGTMRVSF